MTRGCWADLARDQELSSMADSICSFFGLSQAPFSKEISDADLWLPASKQSVVEHLVEALQGRHSLLLTGEPGVGKTCVLRALRQQLPPERFRLTYCHNATLGRRDFYRQLSLALGLSPKATAASVFYAVTGQVQELAATRLHPVFLLDEAHLLHSDVLGHLHILLNYEWDSRALLSAVLVGLPELEDRLALSTHKSLLSRLHYRLRIDPVTPADSAEYLRYRLQRAGCDRELFPEDALALLHEASQGTHRELDRLAWLCLREAARSKKKLVDRDLVRLLLERQHPSRT
jgi:general secretion pathway protein A